MRMICDTKIIVLII